MLKSIYREHGDMTSTFGGAGNEWHDYGVEQTSRQVILIRTMIKQALLCSIAIFSRFIVDLFILGDELIYHPVWKINLLFLIRKIVSVAAICLQILCIYLSYHFAEGTYNFCCSCCHQFCQKKAEHCAKSKFERDLDKQVTMDYFRL